MTLDDYFAEIELALRHPFIRQVHFQKDKRSEKDSLFEGKIIFLDESELHVTEYVQLDTRIERVSYRYHYQTKNKQMIFRYDNTPHFPQISTYPDHKHTPNGTEESLRPTLEDILDEIVYAYLNR